MSISIRKWVFHLLIVIGMPAAILAGLFLSILVILYPVSRLMGWV